MPYKYNKIYRTALLLNINLLFSLHIMKTTLFFIALFFSVAGFSQQQPTPGVQPLVNNKRFADHEHVVEKPSATKKPLEKRGEAYGRNREWDKAAGCYKQLIERYPDVADYHYKYGGFLGMMALKNKLKAMGLVGDIKRAFRKAAELDAKHTGARRALVELYMQLPGILGGSRKKALRYAGELQEIAKPEGYLAMGYIYEYDRKPEKAKKYYILALQHLNDIKEFSRNQLHYKIGQLCGDYAMKLDDGLLHLQKYIRNTTSYHETELHVAYCAMAKLYRLKSEKAKAMKWINKALDDAPDAKEALEEKRLIEAL